MGSRTCATAAPKRDAALADVSVAEVFVLGAKEPGGDSDQAEEGHGDKKLGASWASLGAVE